MEEEETAGRGVRAEVHPEVEALRARHGLTPTRLVVQVGVDPASTRYVGRKLQSCEKLGMKAIHHIPAPDIGEQALRDEVDKVGARPDVHGVLVQLLLP